MKNQKLNLTKLTVKSFVSQIDKDSKNTVKGGKSFFRSRCLDCDDPFTVGPNCPF